MHNCIGDGLGRAGAIVAFSYPPTATLNAQQEDAIQKTAHQLAMHIVAARPLYLSRDQVPQELIEKERNILLEQIETLNKPKHIKEKMVNGRLDKFFGQIALLEQEHMIQEGNPAVHKVLDLISTSTGVPISIAGYHHYEIGQSAF